MYIVVVLAWHVWPRLVWDVMGILRLAVALASEVYCNIQGLSSVVVFGIQCIDEVREVYGHLA